MITEIFLTAELEKVRQELLVKHNENVRKYEQQLRLVQQERQAVFQDAFQEDLRSYQTLGTIPSMRITLLTLIFTNSLDILLFASKCARPNCN